MHQEMPRNGMQHCPDAVLRQFTVSLDLRGQGVKHVQENVPAPRRGSRKRGAAAQTLDTVAEEEQPEDEAKPEETEAEDVQDIDIVGDAGVPPVAKPKGKPPLSGKPQRGRAAKKEDADTGERSAGRCAHTCHVPNLLVWDHSLSDASCGKHAKVSTCFGTSRT